MIVEIWCLTDGETFRIVECRILLKIGNSGPVSRQKHSWVDKVRLDFLNLGAEGESMVEAADKVRWWGFVTAVVGSRTKNDHRVGKRMNNK